MDKIATNNFIVVLRKDVRNAKKMVAGNLVRKIKELKEALAKEGTDAATKGARTEDKINKIHADIKLLKGLDEYQICKKAIIKPDSNYWKSLISDSKASKEDILAARVICKGKVQKEVAKFRSDHADCDEWLEEYFEFREKKRQLTEAEIQSRKKKFSKDKNIPSRVTGEKRVEKPIRDRSQPRKSKLRTENNSDKILGTSDSDSLHPSWASKRREKELIKEALAKGISKTVNHQPTANRVILNTE